MAPRQLSRPVSKRSPSPIISSENPKGVKNITRKVIKRLEGLGHLEMVDADFSVPEEDELDSPCKDEDVFSTTGLEAVKRPSSDKHYNNGSAIVHTAVSRIDFEIPRKLLHSSIGFLTLYLYVSEANVDSIVKALWLALCVILPADLLRFRSSRFERTYERVLGSFMRESEKNSINGVVWYILGVNFVLSFYPQDVATVAILILSWADTAASTLGRLYGANTRKLPSHLPFLRLPLAPRKSLAGFMAATFTASAIALGFWAYVAPMRAGGAETTWSWVSGVRRISENGDVTDLGVGGLFGLIAISVVSGLVGGVAEALEVGPLDDNLTLPIISGGCILGFFKLIGSAVSWLSS
jgi:diacylglycerol kinase (CTP)